MVVAATGLLHLLLVGWLTWPLPLRMATDLPDATFACRFDTLLIAWALAQQAHALLTSPSTFGQANIFHPTRYALFYGEAAFGALPYFLPVFAWTGNPTLAINLVLLGCTGATAMAVHLVTRRITDSWLAGGVAAWAWLTAPWTLFTFVPSAPGYAVLQYLPIIMVCAWRPLRRRRDVIGLAGLLALQSLSSIYVAVSTTLPVALLALVRVARSQSRRAGFALLAAVALAIPIVLATYSGYAIVRNDNPGLQAQSDWPTTPMVPLDPRWGNSLGPLWPRLVPPAFWLLIGVGALVRLRYGAHPSREKAWRVGAFWTAVGLAVSTRPAILWSGRTWLLPHAILAKWTPFYDAIRHPETLGISGLMGSCLLAGVAFAECHAVVGRAGASMTARSAFVGFTLACLVAAYCGSRGSANLVSFGWPGPYPIRAAPQMDPALAAALREDRGPMLEIPAEAPWEQANVMYRSIQHGRPMLNGYSGYWPAGFKGRMQLAQQLPDRAPLALLMQLTGLKTVVVHLDSLRWAKRRQWLAMEADPAQAPLRFVARSGDVVVFSAP